ncbi:DUF2442 domain-containing protein [bacterium]|nr:DUF2442 domain-containing protein [bacterium]MBU1754167.1 DUF2442 domain-containing protein [bacterium]
MVKITQLQVLENYCLDLVFDDGVEKIIDGTQFFGDNLLTKPLSDPEYFQQVKIYENGRGIYWPNEYDICPDNLRYHIKALETHHKVSQQSSQAA